MFYQIYSIILPLLNQLLLIHLILIFYNDEYLQHLKLFDETFIN